MMHCSRQISWKILTHRLVLMAFPLAFLLFFLFPQNANAYAILLSSDPAKDSILSASPDQIRMWFSEDLNPAFSTAYIVNAVNSANNLRNDIRTHVDKGDAYISATDSKEMDVSLKPNLPSAIYVLFYRTQSADDGHILSGSFAFTIAAANGTFPSFNGTIPQGIIFTGSGSASGQLDGPTLFSFIMIVLVDLGAVFWVGAQLWRIFVISEPSEDQDQQAIFRQMEQRFDRRFSCLVLLLIFLANIGILVGQVLALTGNQWAQAFTPSLLVSLVAHGQFGMYWIMRQIIILLALLLFAFTMVIKQPSQSVTSSISWGNFILGLALLVALTLSGQTPPVSSNILVYAVLGDFLHLVAAALWVGEMMFVAVIYLPLLKNRPWQQQTASLLSTLPRYYPLAIAGIVLMGLSGPLDTATRLSADQLFTTAYGRTLIIKALLVAAMLLTTAVHALLLRPRLAKDFKAYQAAAETAQPPREELTDLAPTMREQVKEMENGITQQTRRLSTLLRWEPVLGVAVLLCTGLLTVFYGTLLQPATTTSQSVSQPQSAPSKPLTTTVNTTDKQFRVMVKIDPNHFGANTFTATVFDSRGKPVPASNISVSLYTTMLDMDMGTDLINLQPDGKGHFSGSGNLGMGGNWQLSVEIRTLDGKIHQSTLKFFTPF